jgi:hypothetical protein
MLTRELVGALNRLPRSATALINTSGDGCFPATSLFLGET